jgi:hypothetical protein
VGRARRRPWRSAAQPGVRRDRADHLGRWS